MIEVATIEAEAAATGEEEVEEVVRTGAEGEEAPMVEGAGEEAAAIVEGGAAVTVTAPLHRPLATVGPGVRRF